MKTLYSLLFAALLLLPTAVLAQVPGACEGGYPGKLTIHEPDMIAGDYNAGIMSGDGSWADTTGLVPPGTTGSVVIARSPGGTTFPSGATSLPDQGCEELTNASEIAGNIALIPRGSCEFGLKALYAQNAGAIGVIIRNNDEANPDTPLNLGGGASGIEVEIGVLSVSYNNGEMIREQLEDFEVPVSATLTYDDCYLTVAAEENVVPGVRELSPARPNPFAGRTQIDLSLDAAQNVTVAVYNVLGQKVATLHEGALSADLHTFAFEASTLPAGVYLVRAEGETFAQTRQVTLVR